MRTTVLCGLTLLLAATIASAASFDCTKAKTDVEKMICADPQLSQLDEELEVLYVTGLKKAESPGHQRTLRSWQQAWLKYRDEKCNAHTECSIGLYRYRISIFDRLVEDAKRPTKRDRAVLFMFDKGQGVPVCEAYKRFLDDAAANSVSQGSVNSFLMCQRTMPSDFPALSQPVWREIDPREHMDLAITVKNRMAIPWAGEEPPKAYLTPELIEGTRLSIVNQTYKYHHDKWYLAQADVDNDERVDSLVKYQSGRCDEASPDVERYQIPIMVISEDGKSVDGPKTRQLLRLDPDRSFSINPGSLDLFAFRGQTYVDRWDNYGEFNGMPTNDKTLSVYLNQRDKNVLVCQYWFPGKESR